MRVCLSVCLVRFCAKVQILSSWIFAFQFPHKASSSGGTLDDEFRAVCCEESPMCLMVSLLPFFYHEVFVGCRVDGWGFGEEGSSAVPGCRRIFWGQVGVGSLGRRGGGLGRACSWTQPTPSAPAEGHVSRAVAPFLHQWLVKLSAGS